MDCCEILMVVISWNCALTIGLIKALVPQFKIKD